MTDTIDIDMLKTRVLATVRAVLIAAGQTEIIIDDRWLEGEITGENRLFMTLTVPIGRDLALPVYACARGDLAPQESAARFANELVRVLPNIEQARWRLRRYAGDVRRAAEAAIAAAQAEGLELALEGVRLRPTRSFHLATASWRDAEDGVLAMLDVRVLDACLNTEIEEIIVEQPGGVAALLAELHEDQRARQDERDRLHRSGAQVAVDTVTLRLLERYGIDALEAIRDTAASGRLNIAIHKADGAAGWLMLHVDDGTIRSTVLDAGDFVWTSYQLQAEGADAATLPDPVIGGPVAQVCADPLYAGMTIVQAHRTGYGACYRIAQPLHLVDLTTGRIWEDRARRLILLPHAGAPLSYRCAGMTVLPNQQKYETDASTVR